jgi:hypothetical protein
MYDKTAAAIQKAAQIIKRSTDIQIRNIHMPMLMRQERLLKPCSLFTGFPVPPIQQSCFRKNPPNA